MSLKEQMTEIGRRAKAASRLLVRLSKNDRNRCLEAMADALESKAAELKAANEKDLQTGREMELSAAMMDRLTLTDKRITDMAQGLREVAALPDPIGRTLDERVRPNGLKLKKVSTPIGVIVIIYESRPNVTADAAGLCFKAGNATILRGGKEALHSNQLIASTMVTAAKAVCPAFPDDAVQVVPTTDRAAIPELLSLTEYVDLCMPRGGEGLIRAVAECSKVPVIKHYKGVCHVYVDAEADPEMAARIAVNSKVQRPGVCNALETLLVDEAVAEKFLPLVVKGLRDHQVELRVDAGTRRFLPELNGELMDASDEDWGAEYLDLILAVRVVKDIDQAIDHINRHGSAHSDCIVTRDESRAEKFMNEVDASTVYWNASTRFTDGAQFGMGAEIGISTDKIGARGPMGLEELTSYKWLAFGSGQIRE